MYHYPVLLLILEFYLARLAMLPYGLDLNVTKFQANLLTKPSVFYYFTNCNISIIIPSHTWISSKITWLTNEHELPINMSYLWTGLKYEHELLTNISYIWTWLTYEHELLMNIWVSHEHELPMDKTYEWTWVTYEHKLHMDISYIWPWVTYEHKLPMNISYIWT